CRASFVPIAAFATIKEKVRSSKIGAQVAAGRSLRGGMREVAEGQMVQRLDPRLMRLAVSRVAWLLPLIGAGLAHGQTLRGPDLGVWFIQQRGSSGAGALMVADLIGDGPFASA